MGIETSSIGACNWHFKEIPMPPPIAGPIAVLTPNTANGASFQNSGHEHYFYQQDDGVFRIAKLGGSTNIQYWHIASYKLFTGTDSSTLALQLIPDLVNGVWLFNIAAGKLQVSAFSDIYFEVGSVEVMRIYDTNKNVGIGTAAPVACAKLEIASTSQGFLLPRMTTAEKNAIGSPTEGLIVYDISLDKACLFTAGAWATIVTI